MLLCVGVAGLDEDQDILPVTCCQLKGEVVTRHKESIKSVYVTVSLTVVNQNLWGLARDGS